MNRWPTYVALLLAACSHGDHEQHLRDHLRKLGIAPDAISCTADDGCGTGYCDVRREGRVESWRCDYGVSDPRGCSAYLSRPVPEVRP